MKLQLEETKQRVDSQKAEQQKLQKIIADADAEQVQQRKQLEQVEEREEEVEGRTTASESSVRPVCLCDVSPGDQRAGHTGEAAAAAQRRASAAAGEDQDPAVHPQQGRLPLQAAGGGRASAQAGGQEAAAQEEHPGQDHP